jgi:hypothetical protein
MQREELTFTYCIKICFICTQQFRKYSSGDYYSELMGYRLSQRQ